MDKYDRVPEKRYTLSSFCAQAGDLVWSAKQLCWVRGTNQNVDERLTGEEVDNLLAGMKERGTAHGVKILDCCVMDQIQETFHKVFNTHLPENWQRLPEGRRIAARTEAAKFARNALIQSGFPPDYADSLGYQF